ncbi:MAG TPA: flagellar biosynthetic protein FliR [Albitalea sp.]
MNATVLALSAAAPWLAATALLAVRLAPLFMAAPPFGSLAVPATVRVLVVLALAACLAHGAAHAVPPELLEPGRLLAAALGELALGGVMALGVGLSFGAFAMAGRLVDVQVGYGLGQVFDPSAQQSLPALSGVFQQLAVIGFFAADAHVAMLRGVGLSVERFPPGQGWPLGVAAGALAAQVAALFALGITIVAPVVACLFLLDLGLGLLSRTLPQMNAFVLGIPVKTLVALAALSAWMLGAGAAVARVHAALFAGWEALFR